MVYRVSGMLCGAQVRSFKGATTIAAGAFHLGTVMTPMVDLADTAAAGAVENRSGHDQKNNEPPVGGVNNQ